MQLANIKGITIEIDGKTTKLKKALDDVNSSSRKTTKELRDIEKALKFNPGNTELVAQKQKLLAKEVENTSKKLKGLKAAQDEVDAAYSSGKIDGEQYRQFQRDLIETESKLKHYETQLAQSQSKSREFGLAMQESGQSVKAFGDGMKNVGSQMAMTVTAPILGVGAAAAKVGMDFEAGMSKVSAIGGITGKDLDALTDKAKEMGSTTKFSATEASDAFSFMALAGWDANQMLGAIDGTLALAAASGEDLALVTDIVTDGMSMFAMEAAEAGRFADVLAAASANTNTDVKGLGEALKYTGASANAAGLDIEQTSAFLGMLANNGIKGSSAGTTMNAVLRDLGKSAKDGKIQLGDMSVAVYDTEGNMRSLSDIMGDVEKATKDMNDEAKNDALRANFGDEALRGVNIALATGADELKKLEKTMYDAKGTAEKMAEVMSDNLKGEITNLGSALEGLGIQLYESLQPALQKVVEWLQQMVAWLSNLSPETQQTIIIIAALVAAIAPLLIILGTLISATGAVMSAVGGLIVSFSAGGAAAGALAGALAFLVSPAGLVVAALGVLGFGAYQFGKAINEDAIPEVDRFGEKMDGLSEKTRKAADDFYTLADDVSLSLMDMSMRGLVVTDEMANGMIEKFNTMNETITNGLNEQHEKRLQGMQDFFAQSSVLTDEEEAAILAKEEEKHAAEMARREVQQQEIKAIMETASQEKRALTEAEREQIALINEGMKNDAVQALTESEVEQKVIMERLKQTSGQITAQQAIEVVQNSAKQRDETIKNAEKQYNDSVAQIVRMRDETGVITAEQADKMIKEAERQKNDTVTKAKEQHSQVVSEAQSQASEHIDKVNWETGQVLSKWEVFKNKTSGVWNNIKSETRRIWNETSQAVREKAQEIYDKASERFEKVRSSAKEKFDAAKKAMVEPVEKAKELISNAVEKIKGFFSGMKLSFPKISMPPLPHFSLKGNFSLMPPSVPKLSVSWHADGGIFNSPTLFATPGGLHGVGEAGAEAIIPLKESVLAAIGKGIAATMATNNSGNSELVITAAPIYLDGEEIAQVVFEEVDRKIGNKARIKQITKGGA